MSINGHFREITPGLLRQIQDDPSLTRSVILGSTSMAQGMDAARAHYERLNSPAPSREKDALAAALQQMSPAQRKIAMFAVSKLGDFFKSSQTQTANLATLEPGSLGEHLSVAQAWHGVHFLLSGAAHPTPFPLGQAMLGGIEIGEDTGYGSPRYLNEEAVDRVASALSSVSASELRRRYNAKAMNAANLYPDSWDEPESVDWLVVEYERVREFYAGVASRENAALLYHI